MIWMLGCSGAPTPTVAPAPVPPPAPAIETAFVHASLLRLRVAPDPASAWTPLPIDSRVRVLERRTDWVRVIAPDGRAGWVAAEFLGQAPLDPVEVQRRVEAATDPAERVVWAERAAALSPGDAGKLGALVAAYRAAGREDDANKVDEALRLDEGDRFDKWFAAYREPVAALGTALQAAATGELLIARWVEARELTAAMGEPLAAGYDEVEHRFIDGDPTTMLAERMPWATVRLYADGAVPALELEPSAWIAAAAKTPEAWDDAFFALITAAYDTASARGWTAWQRRTWDFGGCSPFGGGERLHVGLLLRTDPLLAVPAVAPVVAEVRAGVLADVIDKPADDPFPYCAAPGQPTPVEGLLGEAQAILAEVALTADERARLEARIRANFGR